MPHAPWPVLTVMSNFTDLLIGSSILIQWLCTLLLSSDRCEATLEIRGYTAVRVKLNITLQAFQKNFGKFDPMFSPGLEYEKC
jgi:hypothetical protein